MSTTNPAAVKAAFEVLKAVADAIREIGSVPSGHLYACLMSDLSLDQYEQVIATLKQAGLITESHCLLTWVSEQKSLHGSRPPCTGSDLEPIV